MTPASPLDGDPTESRGARHAALLLHALTDEDRAWMLNAMPPAERRSLQRLLLELAAMGIERDPALIAQATAEAPTPADRPVTTSAPDAKTWDEPDAHARPFSHLDGGQIRTLAGALGDEPPVLVARFLCIDAWHWRAALLDELGPVSRRRVEAALAECAEDAIAPALRVALLQEVLAKWREHGNALATEERSSPTRRQRLGHGLGEFAGRLFGHIAQVRTARRGPVRS